MAARAIAPAPATVARTAEPGRTHSTGSARVQRSALRISSPSDSAEREAETTARRVMTMGIPGPNPAIAPRERVSLLAARAPAVKPVPDAKANETSPAVTAAIKAARGGGSPLSAKTRAFMEPRFKASFAGVHIHTGKSAATLNEQLGARAFAYGRDIFFSPGAYQPDTPAGQELLAHELTHTIQQREVVQRDVVQAGVDVKESAAPQVQRGLLGALSDAAGAIANAAGAVLDAAIKVVKDFAADKANSLPGFRLLCIILGKNPVNDQPVSGGGAAILREIVGFVPFGDKIVEAFNNHGIFEKGGAFVDTQFKALKRLGGALIGGIKGVFKGIGLSDATNPGGIWDRITGFFSSAFSEVKVFGTGLVTGVVTLVREVIVPPLGRWAAANIPKWDLLMAVLGKNPVSDDQESPASQIIGAFMTLIGQEEIWSNIKKGNAVGRAWQWFQTALKGAKNLVSGLPGQVIATLKSFTIMDVLTIAGAFKKLLGLFGSFVGQFGSWAGGTILSLLEIILSVVAPNVVPYLKKAGGAFNTIIKNPVGFVRTLVAAGKQGFNQFAGNFLAHLKASLIGWLTGSLAGAGVYIPAGFTVMEILKFVLSVMGLTWANVRGKLVAATSETVVKGLEEGFHIVKTLVTEGPAAAWQEIVKSLTNLKQMAIDAVMDFVKSKIVEVAVTKLLSMLSPAGAFIQAILAIYNTVMFFVERIRQIAAVAASFIDSIAAIASGNIVPAAARVEKTMAGMLVLVISFLARLAGLGKVSDAVLGLVNRIRAPINKALDAVVAWIVAQAKKLGKILASGASGLIDWWKEKKQFTNSAGESHTLSFRGTGNSAKLMIASNPNEVATYLANYSDKTKPEYKSAKAVFDRASRVIFTQQAKNVAEAVRRQQVSQALADIGAAFAKLAGDAPTDVDYPTTKDATPQGVEHIVGQPKPGSKPSRDVNIGPPGWDKVVKAQLHQASDRWVRMHIVSEALGGKGEPSNLIPAPNSINSGPFRQFELLTRDLAKAKSGNIKNVVWVTVDVTPAGGGFARRIRGQSGLYLWKGKEGGKPWLKNSAYSFFAQAAIPAPDLSAATFISLNNSGGVDLAKLGIGQKLIDIIKEQRRFPSLKIFVQRVAKRAAEAKVEDAANKVNAIVGHPKVVLNDPAPPA